VTLILTFDVLEFGPEIMATGTKVLSNHRFNLF